MLIAVIAIYANIYLYKTGKQARSLRLVSYIEACCLWMLYLFTITELFSIWHMVRFKALFAAWGVLDVVLLVVIAVQIRKDRQYRKGKHQRIYGMWQTLFARLRRYPYYCITILIGAWVLLLAFLITPYNWDSMTYHLPRIAYWTQNRSVEHYATNSIRQIASPVLGEFVNLHVYILSRGKDTLFNMLQAFSYVMNAFLVERIARRLGCSRGLSFIGALLYMTMPIAYAEALTTQVDNFATVWLLFYVYVLLDLVEQRDKLGVNRTAIRRVCTLGLCVAWGYLTKPSVCIAMVVFALWLLIKCIVRKDKVWDLIRLVLCALPCLALPLAPEILRNFKTFHAYASKSAGARQLVATLKPSYLFINFLKNFTFNTPTALIRNSDQFFAKPVRAAAEILNVEINAESISEGGRDFGLHAANTYGCDTAINPIVMWLFLFAVLWAVFMIRKINWKEIRAGYLLAGTISFCIFCTVLRWEPFVSRYMVSYFALLCPMISVCIQKGTEREGVRPARYAIVGIIGFLCVMEAISVTAFHYDIYTNGGANNRPYGYFAARRSETVYYAKVTDDIKGKEYESVGLHLMKADDYEYPIWEMLGSQRIEHINVKNESAIYADHEFTPDCIIWFGALPEEPVVVNGTVYKQLEDYGEKHYLLGKS